MQVTVNVATVDTPLASGQTLGDWVIGILDVNSAVVGQQTVPDPTAVFDVADAGTYTAFAYRLDSTSAMFGERQTSAPFDVVLPAFGKAAGAVTVTVG